MITNNIFEKALKNLLNKEGDYSNYIEDNGGETYKGISRVYNKDWNGWTIIDKYKDKIDFLNKFNKIDQQDKYNLRKLFKQLDILLNNNNELQENVKKFYYNKYWKPMKLDEIINFDQKLAIKLFTFAVNNGTYKIGIKYLQESLNYLNRNGKEYPDLVIDGLIGSKTINAIKHLNNQGYINLILIVIKLLQGRHYLNLMDQSPLYKEFRGWFTRVDCN